MSLRLLVRHPSPCLPTFYLSGIPLRKQYAFRQTRSPRMEYTNQTASPVEEVFIEWSDPEGDDGAPIPARRLLLNLRNWVAVATANDQACAEWATRVDERRNTAAHGHAILLGAFRFALGVSVDEAGSISWRSRARRLVDLAARWLVGPSAHRMAHRPSGRGPGSEFALERRIAPLSRAWGLIPRRG